MTGREPPNQALTGMPTAPLHIVAVTGLVRDAAGRVVLVRNDRGWEMPGGQVELGEDPLTALRREVTEEAGCDIEVGRLFGLYSNVSIGLMIMAFDCAYVGGAVRAGAECRDARWYEPEAAIRATVHAPALDRIRDGLSQSGSVVFRSYEMTSSGGYHMFKEGLI